MDKTNEPDADELAQRIQNRAVGRIDELLRKDAQEVTPQELWNTLWGNGLTEHEFVVTVDPKDMKSACRMGQGSRGAAMGLSALGSVCSPGANAIAIWYRLRMVGLCDYAGVLSAHKQDGDFTDAVYRVAATFPMKRMEADVTYQEPPFDVDEFVKQVERASAG